MAFFPLATGQRLVVCTQPRAMAAISIARRVAEEYDGTSVGQSVGHTAGSRSAGSGAQSCLIIFNRFRSALFFLQGARLARPSCLSAGSSGQGHTAVGLTPLGGTEARCNSPF